MARNGHSPEAPLAIISNDPWFLFRFLGIRDTKYFSWLSRISRTWLRTLLVKIQVPFWLRLAGKKTSDLQQGAQRWNRLQLIWSIGLLVQKWAEHLHTFWPCFGHAGLHRFLIAFFQSSSSKASTCMPQTLSGWLSEPSFLVTSQYFAAFRYVGML